MGKKKYTADDINPLKPRSDLIRMVDISRGGFSTNLVSAAQHALEFARTLVFNELPDVIRYVVYLGASYDGNALIDDEETFSEDYTERIRQYSDSSDVVNLLWRDGKVPEWIDVAVESEDGKSTSVRLDCCGRYSDDVAQIYHAHENRAPFHVLGPSAPPEYELAEKGIKYDLYWGSRGQTR